MNQIIPRINFAVGEVIFRQGQESDKMYLIRSGAVEISINSDGQKKVLAEMKEGNILGEMGLIDNSPRSATATAITPTECYYFEKGEFEKRMRSLDPFMQALVKVLVKTVRTLNEKK